MELIGLTGDAVLASKLQFYQASTGRKMCKHFGHAKVRSFAMPAYPQLAQLAPVM